MTDAERLQEAERLLRDIAHAVRNSAPELHVNGGTRVFFPYHPDGDWFSIQAAVDYVEQSGKPSGPIVLIGAVTASIVIASMVTG